MVDAMMAMQMFAEQVWCDWMFGGTGQTCDDYTY
jgi:hypothetical protein